jgi:hypothetical protein
LIDLAKKYCSRGGRARPTARCVEGAIDVPTLRATPPVWDLVAASDGISIAGRYHAHGATGALKNALDCFLAIDKFAGKLLGRPKPRPGTCTPAALRETPAT